MSRRASTLAFLLALAVEPLSRAATSAPAAAPTRDPHGIGALLDASSSGAELRFCRDPSYELGAGERVLCDFAPAAAARCPAFAAACATRLTPIGDPRPRSGWLAALAHVLRLTGFLLFWVLLAVTVGVAAWLGVRLWPARASRAGPAPAGADGTARATPEAPGFEREFEAHLERARRLAAQARFPEAAAELQLGVVLRLDALGFIRARRGRTNGDYAGELALRQPELQAAFGALTRATEAVQFGGRNLDASAFERLLQGAAPLLGALLLALAALSGPLACQSVVPSSQRSAQVCGGGADGHSLLCALFSPEGGATQRFRPLDAPDALAADVATVVVLPNHLTEDAWAILEGWVERGGVLVLATPAPRIDVRFGVTRGRTACGPLAAVLPSSERSLLVSPGGGLIAPSLRPAAVCETGETYIGHADWGSGRVLFLPGAELLSNASLVAGENARLLANLLDLPEGRMEIIGSLTRDAMTSPLGAVAAAGLTPWLCQLLLLAAAFAAYRGMPFGRHVEPRQDRRRRFSEHVQALGQRWADQGASRSALSAYAGYAFERLRERVPAAAGRTSAGLASAIAQKTGRDGARVAYTLDLTRRVQDGAVTGTEAEHLQALRDLGRLLEDLGGPR